MKQDPLKLAYSALIWEWKLYDWEPGPISTLEKIAFNKTEEQTRIFMVPEISDK